MTLLYFLSALTEAFSYLCAIYTLLSIAPTCTVPPHPLVNVHSLCLTGSSSLCPSLYIWCWSEFLNTAAWGGSCFRLNKSQLAWREPSAETFLCSLCPSQAPMSSWLGRNPPFTFQLNSLSVFPNLTVSLTMSYVPPSLHPKSLYAIKLWPAPFITKDNIWMAFTVEHPLGNIREVSRWRFLLWQSLTHLVLLLRCYIRKRCEVFKEKL